MGLEEFKIWRVKETEGLIWRRSMTHLFSSLFLNKSDLQLRMELWGTLISIWGGEKSLEEDKK